MTATLVIDACATWTPPGWIYNHLVSHLAQRFMRNDKRFADLLEQCLGPANAFLDWRSLSDTQQAQIIDEMHSLSVDLLDRMEGEDPEMPFLEQLRSELQYLLVLLQLDFEQRLECVT